MKIHAYLIDPLKKIHAYNQRRHFKLLPARENKKRKRFELANEIPHGVKKDFLSLTWVRKIIQKILANTGKRCFPNIFPTRQSAASPILLRPDPIFMHAVHLNFHYACQAGAKTGAIRVARRNDWRRRERHPGRPLRACAMSLCRQTSGEGSKASFFAP